jgi:hypothetical protein
MTKPAPLPSLDRLNELFVYHADVGEISWAKPTRGGRRKKYVGCLDRSRGYRRVWIGKHFYVLHRIIWKMATGRDPLFGIDHINGNPADNRISNLREATCNQNNWNRRIEKRNSTGLKGVRKNKHGSYVAQIAFHGKKIYLGSFDTPARAHDAYWMKAQELFGDFARRE